MSGDDALRGLAFASLDGSTWGAALGGERPALVVGTGRGGSGFGDLGLSADDDGWRLEGDDVSLTARPLRDAVAGAALCQVSGTAGELSVDCPGVAVVLSVSASARGRRRTASGAVASVRLVGGVFEEASGVALLAARPLRAAHQDADEIAAALFDAEEWLAVHDPRLSTTYDEAGAPTRTNLELWVGEGEDEFPRRAAGEAAGAGRAVALDGGTLRVVPLRCHSRGGDGAGVYALATF
jgi:hypothetical protein